MAPEQMTADPHLDHRVDIYAVGVMAYEMLTGTQPFPGATPQALFAAQVAHQPTRSTCSGPGIPPALSQTILRCLRAAARRPVAERRRSSRRARAAARDG